MGRLHRGRSSSSIVVAESGAAFVVAAALAVAGCAQAAPGARNAADTHEAPPPHLGAGGPGDRPEHTDPLPDPSASGEVSLGGILAYADRYSPVLAVARSTRSRAEAARVAASILLPTNPEVTVAAGPRFGASGRGIDVTVTLMQQIQVAGERGLRIDAADRLRDITDAEIEQMRWAVHCDVHEAFHRALVERDLLRLAERVVTFQQEVLLVVQRQIAAGETAPLALRLAQAEVAQAQQVLVAAQQAFLVSRIRLAQLSGWPAAAPPMPNGTADAPQDPPPVDFLAALARERLPSLRAAALRIREAEARADLADREAWPRPSVGLQYSREGTLASEGLVESVLGIVSIPIPSFQTNQGERALARADATVAQAELGAAQQLLDGQIAQARSEVVAAAQRARTYGTEILPRFEENLTLLRRSFELGEIDILALSAGLERFLRIQSDALGAQQDYFVALAALERVVGAELGPNGHIEENSP